MIDIGQEVYVGVETKRTEDKCLLCKGDGMMPPPDIIRQFNTWNGTDYYYTPADMKCPHCKGTGKIRTSPGKRDIHKETVKSLEFTDGEMRYEFEGRTPTPTVFETLEEAYRWLNEKFDN